MLQQMSFHQRRDGAENSGQMLCGRWPGGDGCWCGTSIRTCSSFMLVEAGFKAPVGQIEAEESV